MLGVLLFAVVAYLVAGFGLFVFQRHMVFQPDRTIQVPGDWRLPLFRVVTVTTADGLGIDGWYAPAAADRPTVVLFHGSGGHLGLREGRARVLHQAGYGVLLAGYRGYAGNPGWPSEKGLYADARAALDFLVGQGVSGRRLVLYGESLGCAVAVQMASERRVGAVILETPFTRLAEVVGRLLPLFPVALLLRDRFDLLSAVGGIQVPLLLLHGEKDRMVPVRLGRAVFAAASQPKQAVWLAQAGHTDMVAHGALETVLGFLNRLGKPVPVPPPTLEQPRAGRGRALVPR